MSPSKKSALDDRISACLGDPERTPTQYEQLTTGRYNADDVFASPQPRVPVPVLSKASTISEPTSTSINFVEALNSRPTFALPTIQRPLSNIYESPARQRSISPSKRYRKISDLLNLDRPVRFRKMTDLRGALPQDIHRLYDSIVKFSYLEDILPAELKNDPTINIDNPRPFMWRQMTESASSPDVSMARAMATHHQILAIIADSAECANWNRSESAWNTIIHFPLLRLFASNPISVEPITSAQIAPAFRPTFNRLPSEGSSQATTPSVSSVTSSVRTSANSVHKMVDFALVLTPNEDLQFKIDNYTKTSISSTNNQTTYFPLKSRPAPVFIETKTSAGKLEEANVQLGVWVAAWQGCIRAMMHSRGCTGQIITVPLIQVLDGVWTVMFAVDAGGEMVSCSG